MFQVLEVGDQISACFQAPHPPVVVSHHQHHSYIVLHSIVSAFIELASLLDIRLSNPPIYIESGFSILIVEASLAQRIGNIIGHIVVGSVLEVDQQALFLFWVVLVGPDEDVEVVEVVVAEFYLLGLGIKFLGKPLFVGIKSAHYCSFHLLKLRLLTFDWPLSCQISGLHRFTKDLLS